MAAPDWRCGAGALRTRSGGADWRQACPLVFVQQTPQLGVLGPQAQDLVIAHRMPFPPFLESTEPRDCLTVLQLNRETCRRNSADIHGQRLAFGIWEWLSKRYGDGVAAGLAVGTLVWDGGSATRGGTTGSPVGWRSVSGYAFGIGKPSGPMGTSITMSLLLGTRGRPSWS